MKLAGRVRFLGFWLLLAVAVTGATCKYDPKAHQVAVIVFNPEQAGDFKTLVTEVHPTSPKEQGNYLPDTASATTTQWVYWVHYGEGTLEVDFPNGANPFAPVGGDITIPCGQRGQFSVCISPTPPIRKGQYRYSTAIRIGESKITSDPMLDVPR